MAGKVVKTIKIAVTRGDAFADNRPSGSSNTGTYFVASVKDWADFKSFFEDGTKYYFDPKRIRGYIGVLPMVFGEFADLYPDHFASLSSFSAVFKDGDELIETQITLRKNDPRYFMRFADNKGLAEDAFRHLLYSDISLVVLEKTDKGVLVYAEPDYDSLGPSTKPESLTLEDLIIE